MNLMRRVNIFLSLDMKTKALLTEAVYFLGWARFQKFKPFSKVAASLGRQSCETPSTTNNSANLLISKKISHAIYTMSKYTFWESQCFVKAIAAKKMLERRGIGSTIYFGTAKDGDGKLIAHAWLRSGSIYLTGSEEMNRFTVVSKFAWERTSAKGGSDD